MTGSIAVFALAATSLLLVFAIIFHGLIAPIWAIIDCAISDERSPLSKILWIIFLIITWAAGVLIYVFFCESKWLRRLITFCVILYIGFAGLVLSDPNLKAQALAKINEKRNSILYSLPGKYNN